MFILNFVAARVKCFLILAEEFFKTQLEGVKKAAQSNDVGSSKVGRSLNYVKLSFEIGHFVELSRGS